MLQWKLRSSLGHIPLDSFSLLVTRTKSMTVTSVSMYYVSTPVSVYYARYVSASKILPCFFAKNEIY